MTLSQANTNSPLKGVLVAGIVSSAGYMWFEEMVTTRALYLADTGAGILQFRRGEINL